MNPISNLQTLLSAMNPLLRDEAFVFVSSLEGFSPELKSCAIMTFQESEGVTLIIPESVAKLHQLRFEYSWAMITLTVYSDLTAVGFLAAISSKLAQHSIPSNAVSAYYHDHLFVPWEKRYLALQILGEK